MPDQPAYRKRFVEVLTSLCGGESLVQILLKSDARSGLESVSFVNGPAQTIAQTIGEGEIIPHLPNVLRIHVVLFRRETANDRCAPCSGVPSTLKLKFAVYCDSRPSIAANACRVLTTLALAMAVPTGRPVRNGSH